MLVDAQVLAGAAAALPPGLRFAAVDIGRALASRLLSGPKRLLFEVGPQFVVGQRALGAAQDAASHRVALTLEVFSELHVFRRRKAADASERERVRKVGTVCRRDNHVFSAAPYRSGNFGDQPA